jgi:hypothetical protein
MDTRFCEKARPPVDAVVMTNQVIDSMIALAEYGRKRTSTQASEPTVSGQLWTTPTSQCIAATVSSPENTFQDGQCTST